MIIDKELIDRLFEQAAEETGKRTNYDLRTSPEDGSQRMLNAMQPGTEVAVHRHQNSNENIFAITGRLDVILLEEDSTGELKESTRHHLSPAEGQYGCTVPQGTWHTVEVKEPSVIFEAKDGKYGEDASERWGNR